MTNRTIKKIHSNSRLAIFSLLSFDFLNDACAYMWFFFVFIFFFSFSCHFDFIWKPTKSYFWVKEWLADDVELSEQKKKLRYDRSITRVHSVRTDAYMCLCITSRDRNIWTKNIIFKREIYSEWYERDKERTHIIFIQTHQPAASHVFEESNLHTSRFKWIYYLLDLLILTLLAVNKY